MAEKVKGEGGELAHGLRCGRLLVLRHAGSTVQPRAAFAKVRHQQWVRVCKRQTVLRLLDPAAVFWRVAEESFGGRRRADLRYIIAVARKSFQNVEPFRQKSAIELGQFPAL